ncbi:MAG: Holliday junction resolvase RuvX [Balneolaceae bacterium]
MKKYGRLIGIDVGTRRVGLARTDLLRTSANPAGTFSPQEVFDRIGRFMKDDNHPVLAFVVGWPVSTAGTETSATDMVVSFIQKLEKKFPDIPVYRTDEGYSSKRAVEIMIESGTPRKKRREKGRVDQAAAALLLQYFLETNHDFD